MIRSTFALPGVIGATSIAGLVAALAGEGWWDAAAWAGLGVPVAAIGWAMLRRS